MVMGELDPQQVKNVQEATKDVRAKITNDKVANSVTVEFKSSTPEGQHMSEILRDQFAQQMAVQLGQFFGIQGEMIERV